MEAKPRGLPLRVSPCTDGRGFWIAEAHHRDGKRFDVRAEES